MDTSSDSNRPKSENGKNTRGSTIRAAIARVLAMGAASIVPAHHTPAATGMEKCDGMAKAGPNDCGTNKHSYATFSSVDRDSADLKGSRTAPG